MNSCHERYGGEDAQTTCAAYFDYGTGRQEANCVVGDICGYTCESIWSSESNRYEAHCTGRKCDSASVQARIAELEALYAAWTEAQENERQARIGAEQAQEAFTTAW